VILLKAEALGSFGILQFLQVYTLS